jgi:hypothetical protein
VARVVVHVVGSAVVARAVVLKDTTNRSTAGEQGPCLEEGPVLGPISGGLFWVQDFPGVSISLASAFPSVHQIAELD